MGDYKFVRINVLVEDGFWEDFKKISFSDRQIWLTCAVRAYAASPEGSHALMTWIYDHGKQPGLRITNSDEWLLGYLKNRKSVNVKELLAAQDKADTATNRIKVHKLLSLIGWQYNPVHKCWEPGTALQFKQAFTT